MIIERDIEALVEGAVTALMEGWLNEVSIFW